MAGICLFSTWIWCTLCQETFVSLEERGTIRRDPHVRIREGALVKRKALWGSGYTRM